jgi:hypothetical protein
MFESGNDKHVDVDIKLSILIESFQDICYISGVRAQELYNLTRYSRLPIIVPTNKALVLHANDLYAQFLHICSIVCVSHMTHIENIVSRRQEKRMLYIGILRISTRTWLNKDILMYIVRLMNEYLYLLLRRLVEHVYSRQRM